MNGKGYIEMSLTTKLAIVIFTSFAIIAAVCTIIDTLRYNAENSADEVREIPVEQKQEPPPDEFDTLYMNVADGDENDRNYWLGSVRRKQGGIR